MNNAMTIETTAGYTQEELDAINTVWQKIVLTEGLENGTDEYMARRKQFVDDIASKN